MIDERFLLTPAKVTRGFYSGYGRILRVFMHPFSSVSDPKVLSKKFGDFRQFFDELIKDNPELRIYVFVESKGPNGDRTSFPFGDERVVCVHLYEYFKSCSLSHKWTQDSILIDSRGRYFFRKEYSLRTAGVLSAFLPNGVNESESLWFGEELSGGNFLIGTHTRDFIFSGLKALPTNSVYTSKPDPFDFFSFHSDKLMPYYRAIFYHIDLYATLIGPGDGEEQLLLLAEIKNAPLEKLNDQISRLYKSKKGGPKIKIDRLPMFVWGEPGEKEYCVYLLLSYNNCLVENYLLENGKRKVVLYLPGFTQTIENYVSGIFTTKKLKSELDVFVNSTLEYLKALNIAPHYTHNKPTLQNLLKDARALVHHTEESIRTKYTAYPGWSTEVRFLQCNYSDFVARKGSLHCMTKVVQRSF